MGYFLIPTDPDRLVVFEEFPEWNSLPGLPLFGIIEDDAELPSEVFPHEGIEAEIISVRPRIRSIIVIEPLKQIAHMIGRAGMER